MLAQLLFELTFVIFNRFPVLLRILMPPNDIPHADHQSYLQAREQGCVLIDLLD